MAAGGGVIFTLRKHWKKSIFAISSLSYGLHYSSQKYREYLVRREYFSEAEKYGEEMCHPLEKPRRLYVILNPYAGDSNSKKNFMKNAAPIFHLAGIDVTYIQTYNEGHSKTMANYFDPSIDGIVVAGGDGTLQEVVTGIMRQDDERIADTPVGFIPLGYSSNSIYKKIFGSNEVNVQAVCKSALAVVKGETKMINILNIKTSEKSIYALSSLHIGIHQQIKEKIEKGKYWVLGPLRRYFSVVWKTFKDWPPVDSVSYSTNTLSAELQSNLARGLSLYLKEDAEEKPYMVIKKLKDEFSRTEFIGFGCNWIDSNFSSAESTLFDVSQCDTVSIEYLENEQISFDIDGEIYDPRNIEISINPKKLKVFC